MKLSEQYFLLKEKFNPLTREILLPDSDTRICNFDFFSPIGIYDDFVEKKIPFPATEDSGILENRKFTYPVFVPGKKTRYNSVIILLHGLNERSWNKHLAWARYLSESTDKPVILFPISFHMNRSLPQWSDRSEVLSDLEIRQSNYRDIQGASIANIILSSRLTEVPQRFFLSGYQSAIDLNCLLGEIGEGGHPLFLRDTRVDFFSYSIGVFLTECMMIAGNNKQFEESRFVFFAGGSLFEEMNGVSKYIMDSKAFDRIHKYYMSDMELEMKENNSLRNVLEGTSMGKAFRSMISSGRLKKHREKALEKFNSRVMCIALADDKVIPSKPTIDILKGKVCRDEDIDVMQFPFPSIHENPFPVNLTEYSDKIDDAFLRVFSRSAAFLA